MSQVPAPPGQPGEPSAATSTGNAIGRFLRRRWRGLLIFLVAFTLGYAAASGDSDSDSASPSEPPPPAATFEEPPPPPPPPPPAAVPNPDASYESQCDYVLGNFTESSAGYRFLAGADIENTGNVGVVVRVTVTWNQLGGPPVKMVKTVKVRRAATRTVPFQQVVSQDQIDRHQSANGKCNVDAKIVDTFGEAVE